nr:hypothetical protein [Tanacetum cinerariifolium]
MVNDNISKYESHRQIPRGTLLWRRGVLLLMLTNKGWVDGNGLIPSGGFEKLGGGQETRGGGDGLKGPGGQLSMV